MIDWIGSGLAAIGIPAELRPIGSFAVVVLAVFLVTFGALWFAVKRRWMSRSTAAFWVFVSPWVFGFLIFTAGPMIYSFVIALFDWNLLDEPVFIGLQNYIEASEDPYVWKALQITLVFAAVSVPLQVLLSLAVALLMNVKVRGIHVFRTIWYLPSLVTGVAQVALFLWVFNPQYGLINGVLAIFGIEGPLWFRDPDWALPAVILMSLWTVGGNMIIYLAGLQDIPAELHEAAALDGAGQLRRFWHVTLPQLSPVIFFSVVTGLIGALQTFTQGYIIQAALAQGTGSGGTSLLFYVLYLYQNAFSYFRMGYASALAWILFVIIMLLTVLVFKGSSFWVFYESARPNRARPNRKERSRVAR